MGALCGCMARVRKTRSTFPAEGMPGPISWFSLRSDEITQQATYWFRSQTAAHPPRQTDPESRAGVCRSPLIGTSQLRFPEHVAFHRIQKLLLRRPGAQARHLIQGIQLEMVPMSRPAWRTWSAIADLSKIVLALLCTVLE